MSWKAGEADFMEVTAETDIKILPARSRPDQKLRDQLKKKITSYIYFGLTLLKFMP